MKSKITYRGENLKREGEKILRPRTWFNRPHPPSATPDLLAQSERWHSQAIEGEAQKVNVPPNTTDQEVLECLDAAQNLILQQPALSNSWRWAEVQETVRSIGRTLPVEVINDGPSGGRAAYGLVGSIVVVRAEFLALSKERAAQVLVHEGTHAQYAKLVSERTGWSGSELSLLCEVCADFDFGFDLATEALAHVNEAAWWNARKDAPITELSASKRQLFEAIRLMKERPGEGKPAFARLLGQYVNHIRRISGDQGVFAGPRLILKGAHRGEYFYPSDVDPAFLTPIFDALT